MIVWILIILSVYILYKWGTSSFDYFEKKGVPYNKPNFLVGSRLSMILRTKNAKEFFDWIYYEFKNEKYEIFLIFDKPNF